MNGININVDEVRRAAAKIGEKFTDISTVSSEIRKIEALVREGWQGDYVEDYLECLRNTRIKVENMGDVLTDIKIDLDGVAKAAVEAENKLTNLMNSDCGGGSYGGR